MLLTVLSFFQALSDKTDLNNLLLLFAIMVGYNRQFFKVILTNTT